MKSLDKLSFLVFYYRIYQGGCHFLKIANRLQYISHEPRFCYLLYDCTIYEGHSHYRAFNQKIICIYLQCLRYTYIYMYINKIFR